MESTTTESRPPNEILRSGMVIDESTAPITFSGEDITSVGMPNVNSNVASVNPSYTPDVAGDVVNDPQC